MTWIKLRLLIHLIFLFKNTGPDSATLARTVHLTCIKPPPHISEISVRRKESENHQVSHCICSYFIQTLDAEKHCIICVHNLLQLTVQVHNLYTRCDAADILYLVVRKKADLRTNSILVFQISSNPLN